MTFDLITIPCRTDNYAFLLHADGKTALVDAPEAGPIISALADRGWGLDEIWITHHHDDHIDGVDTLRRKFGATVRGAKIDAHRLPELDHAHVDGDSFDFADFPVTVMDVSGHTLGHVAFYVAQANAVFTADSLMALGCGRLFEGTPDTMWNSLSRLANLPPETTVCSGHEYTEANGRFAITIEPENPDLVQRISDIKVARSAGQPTVPSTLKLELQTNPFLRAGLQSLKDTLNMSGATDAEVFAEIRRRKDSF
ncbi:hydroxyacylglutathione hydrolase [uncultured Boseongicola sp.]|jgi:hydroxyacylglutathione hydrolase|uniref:hydroxyacylglutathione hydrolase n=1 Tax=uncultured Boseongicola sp. TaxID=1648499 RepID=UPI002606493B|nr:hydroxyacylglutathione hydrolase [uncultured Boseongicola sp.]